MLDGRCTGQELRGASSSSYAFWPRLPLRQNSRRAVASQTSQSVDEARVASGRLACSSVSCCCANARATHVITYPSERPQTEAAPADPVASQVSQASWRSPQSRFRPSAQATRRPRQRQLDISPGQPSGGGAAAGSIASRPAGLVEATASAENGGCGVSSSISGKPPEPSSSTPTGAGDSESEGPYAPSQRQPVGQQHFRSQLHPPPQPQLKQRRPREQQWERQRQSVFSAAYVPQVRSTDASWPDPPQLTRLIGACASWRELDALVTEYAPRFNTIHITAIVTRIARLPVPGGSAVADTSDGSEREGPQQRQQEDLRLQEHQQQEQRYGVGRKWTQSQERTGTAQRGSGRQMELLDWAGFIRVVLALVESHAAELDARGIANISWALAKALPSLPPPSQSKFPAPPPRSPLMQSQSSGLEPGTAAAGPSRRRIDNGDGLGTEGGNEFGIERAVRAAARHTVRRLLALPAADPDGIETRAARGGSAAANAAVGGGAMAPQHVANALWAAASLGILDASDSEAPGSVEAAEAEAKGTRRRESSDIGRACRWVLRAVAAARSALRTRGFSEEGISQLVWSVSELGLTADAAWMEDLYNAVSRQASELSAHSAANVLLSVARMATAAADSNVAMSAVAESDGGHDVYDSATDTVGIKLGGSSSGSSGGSNGGSRGAMAAVAAVTFRQPSDAWLSNFLTDTAATLGSADPVSLANSAWALSVLMRTRTRTGAAAAAAAPPLSPPPPPSSWLRSYYAALGLPGALRRFTDSQLGLMLWSLADLSDARPGGLPWAPPPELLVGLAAELRRRLADMPDKGFAMASWGLQRLLQRQQQRQQLMRLRHLEGQLRVQEQQQRESKANQEGQQQQEQEQEVSSSELLQTGHTVREAGLEAAWLASAARRMPYMADRWLLMMLQAVAGWAPAGADGAWFRAATDAVLQPPLPQQHMLSPPQHGQPQTEDVPAMTNAEVHFPEMAQRKRPLLPRLLQALLLAAEACLPPGHAMNMVTEAAAKELFAAAGLRETGGGGSGGGGGGVHMEEQPTAAAVPWTATELLRCGAALARAGYVPRPAWRQTFFGRVLELAALSATLEAQQLRSNPQHGASQEEDSQCQHLRHHRLSASDVALLLSCSQRWAATASNATLSALLYGVPHEVWTPRSAAWVCRLLALQATQLQPPPPAQQQQYQQQQQQQLQQHQRYSTAQSLQKDQEQTQVADRRHQRQHQDGEMNEDALSHSGDDTASFRGSSTAPLGGSLGERDNRTDVPTEAPSPSATLPSAQYSPGHLDLVEPVLPLSISTSGSAAGSCRPVLNGSALSTPPPSSLQSQPPFQPSRGSVLAAGQSGDDVDRAVDSSASGSGARLRLRTPTDGSFSGLDGESALEAEGFGSDLGFSGMGGPQDVVRVRDVVLVAPRPRPPPPRDGPSGRGGGGAAADVNVDIASCGFSRPASPLANLNGDSEAPAAAATTTKKTSNGLQGIIDGGSDSDGSSGDGDGVPVEARLLPYAPGADGSGGRREEVLQRGPGRPPVATTETAAASPASVPSGPSAMGARGPRTAAAAAAVAAAAAAAAPTTVTLPSASTAPRPYWSSAAAAAATPATASDTNTRSGGSSDGAVGLPTPGVWGSSGDSMNGVYGTGGTARDIRGGDGSNGGSASLPGDGDGLGRVTTTVPVVQRSVPPPPVSLSPPPPSPALRFVLQTLDTACASLERRFSHRLELLPELQEGIGAGGGGGGSGRSQLAVGAAAAMKTSAKLLPPASSATALDGRWSLLSLSQLLWSVVRLRLRPSPRQRTVLHAALTVALLRWSSQPPHAIVPMLWACCRLGMPLGAGLARLLRRALLLHPGLQPAALADGSLLMLLEALVRWRVDPPTQWSRKVPQRLALWLWRVSPAVAAATATSSTFSRRLASATAATATAGRRGANTAGVRDPELGEGPNGNCNSRNDSSSRSGVEAKQLLLVLRALRRLQIAARRDAGASSSCAGGRGRGRERVRSRGYSRLMPAQPLPPGVQFRIFADSSPHTSVRLQLPPRWSPSWAPVVPSKLPTVRPSSRGGARHSGGPAAATTTLTPVDAVLWVELWPMLRTAVRQRLAEIFGPRPAAASASAGVVPLQPLPPPTSPRERLAALMCGAACGLVDWEAWGVPALRRLASELPPGDYHAWLALAVGLQCRVSRGSLEDLLLAWCMASGPQLDSMTPRQLHTTLRLAGRVAETLLQPLSFDWVSVALRRYSRNVAALSPAQLAQVPAVLRRLRRLPPPQWQASYADLVARRALPHMSGPRAQAMLRAAAALSPGLEAELRGPVHARMTELWFGQQALWRRRQRQAAKRQAQHQHRLRLQRWKKGQVQLKNRKRPPTATEAADAAAASR
ncbi:hypothetical protein Vafri_21232 [Volvox africanus]|uniref:Uncharacterized protein n=1 Tax=Volvox africanus TaxID=51714 RepID=A0A8J4BSC9_9CHLO|nr:hypothetical protein Vafri_21232 [Volvox africanus]